MGAKSRVESREAPLGVAREKIRCRKSQGDAAALLEELAGPLRGRPGEGSVISRTLISGIAPIPLGFSPATKTLVVFP